VLEKDINAFLKIDLFLSARYNPRATEFMIGVIPVSDEPDPHVIEPDTSMIGKNVLSESI
jgi:hypothetical protein